MMTAQPTLSPNALRRAIRVSAAVGVIYVVVALYVTWSGFHAPHVFDTQHLLASIPAVLGLVLLGDLLRGLRWIYYGSVLRWPIPWTRAMIAFLASFSLTATPAKAGELLKCGLLYERYGIAVSQSTSVLIVERLGDLIAVFAIAAIGAAASSGLPTFVAAAGVAMVLAALVLSQPALLRRLIHPAGRIPALAGLIHHAEDAISVIATLLSPWNVIVGLSIAAIGWLIEASALNVLLQAMGISIGEASAAAIFGVSTIAGAISMLPGGVGGVEATMVAMLTHAGADLVVAGTAVAIFRLCTIWFGTGIGFLFLILWSALAKADAPLAPIAAGHLGELRD